MASPLDDRRVSHLNSSVYQRILSHFHGEWVSRLNVDQMFILIDGVLPFEACLYYQVLPLFIEGSRLHLGMVSPDDTSASEYVRRIISYLNYSLVSYPISSEALRVVLTAYLNHIGNQQTASNRQAEDNHSEAVSYGHHRHSARTKADRGADASERMTLVVDSPEELYAEINRIKESVGAAPPPKVEPPEVEPPEATPSINEEFEPADETIQPKLVNPVAVPESNQAANVGSDLYPLEAPTEIQLETPTEIQANQPNEQPNKLTSAPQSDLGQDSSSASNGSSNRSLAILRVETKHLSSPVEVLATLPSHELVQELLARVLLGGIGRLYFECHPQDGRIVWSQNGVLQSVLDKLPLPAFRGVIQELRQLACLPLLSTGQPQQTEIEYLYDRSRVMLRFRFMPGRYGEEATVQVLRGAALKFYQQQQLNKLEKDAVNIAQQLKNKLNEIRARAYTNPSLVEPKFEMLPKLNELVHNIEEQLDSLDPDVDDPNSQASSH